MVASKRLRRFPDAHVQRTGTFAIASPSGLPPTVNVLATVFAGHEVHGDRLESDAQLLKDPARADRAGGTELVQSHHGLHFGVLRPLKPSPLRRDLEQARCNHRITSQAAHGESGRPGSNRRRHLGNPFGSARSSSDGVALRRALDRGDVDPFHGQHRLHGTLRLGGIGIGHQSEQALGDNLPG